MNFPLSWGAIVSAIAVILIIALFGYALTHGSKLKQLVKSSFTFSTLFSEIRAKVLSELSLIKIAVGDLKTKLQSFESSAGLLDVKSIEQRIEQQFHDKVGEFAKNLNAQTAVILAGFKTELDAQLPDLKAEIEKLVQTAVVDALAAKAAAAEAIVDSGKVVASVDDKVKAAIQTASKVASDPVVKK